MGGQLLKGAAAGGGAELEAVKGICDLVRALVEEAEEAAAAKKAAAAERRK